MRILSCLVFLSMAAGIVCADGNSNAVNERIPVTPAEMESHWQVDCVNSWTRAIELREKAGSPECALPPGLLRDLRLCTFIHQPPGQQPTHIGPDYQSATTGPVDAVACVPKTDRKQ